VAQESVATPQNQQKENVAQANVELVKNQPNQHQSRWANAALENVVKITKGNDMKKLLYSSFLAVTLLSLSGCYESASNEGMQKYTDGQKTPTMKCGAGKCGSAK
jgi:hypothetical protein